VNIDPRLVSVTTFTQILGFLGLIALVLEIVGVIVCYTGLLQVKILVSILSARERAV